MKRKVIKQGHNTLTVTLPSKWTDKIKVKPGDEIDIEEKGCNLIISSTKCSSIMKKELDITESVVFLERELYSLYKKGYDEILIHSQDPSLLTKIQKILSDTVIGFEIVGQTKNSCTIKNVAEAQYTEFDSILRRTILLLDTQADGLVEAMSLNELALIPNLKYMEVTNNRYTGFLRRVINKNGHDDYNNEKLLYCFIEFLEKISDELKYLCIFFENNPEGIQKIPKEILTMYKNMAKLLRETFEVFYKFDKKRLIELYSERKSIIKESIKMLEKSKGRDNMLIHYVLTITQEIADILAFIMTMEQ
jgi:phosphate uptake regulator